MSGDDVMSADGLGWDPSRVLFPEFTSGRFLSEASQDSEGFYRRLLHTALIGEEPSLEQLALALGQLPEGTSPRLLLLKAHLRQLCRLGAEIGDRLEDHGLGGASGYLEPEPAMLLVNEVLLHHFGESTLESLEVALQDSPHQEEELAILELDQSIPEGFPLPVRAHHTGPEEKPEEGNRVRTENDALSQPTHPKVEASPGRPSTRTEASLQSDAFAAPIERWDQPRSAKDGARTGNASARRPQGPAPPPWMEAVPDTGPDPWIEAAASSELTPGPSERPRGPGSGQTSAPAAAAQASALPLPPPSAHSDREAQALWKALSNPEDEAALAMFPSLPAPPPRQRVQKRAADPAATWEHGADPLPLEWQRSMEELAFEPQQGEHAPLPPEPPAVNDTALADDRRAISGGAVAPSRRALPQGARPTQLPPLPTGGAASSLERAQREAPPATIQSPLTDLADTETLLTPQSTPAAEPSAPALPGSALEAESTLEMDFPADSLPVPKEASIAPEDSPEGISLPLNSTHFDKALPREEALSQVALTSAAAASPDHGTNATEVPSMQEEERAEARTSLPKVSSPASPAAPSGADLNRGPQSGLDVLHYLQDEVSTSLAPAGSEAHPPEERAKEDDSVPEGPPSLAMIVLDQLGAAPQVELEDLLWDSSALLAEAPEEDQGAHALLMVLTRLSKAQQLASRLQQDLDAGAEQRRQLELRLAKAEEEKRELVTRLQTAEAKLSRVAREDSERNALGSQDEQKKQTLDRTETLLDQLFYADVIDWAVLGEESFPARPALAEKFSRLSETLESWRSMAELHNDQLEGLKTELGELKELVTDKEHLILSQDRQLAERDELIQAQNARFKRQVGETARFKVLALWQNARVQILELRRKVEGAMSAKGMFGRRKMPELPQMRELVLAMDHIEDVLSRLQGRMDPSDFQVAEADLVYLRKFTDAFRRYLEKTGNPVTRSPAPSKRAAAASDVSKDEHQTHASVTEESSQVEESFPEPKAIDLTTPMPESGSAVEDGEGGESSSASAEPDSATSESEGALPASSQRAEAVS